MAEPALKVETRDTSASERAPNRARDEDDVYAWLIQEADLPRARRLEGLDPEHVAEELEGLSRSAFDRRPSPLRVRVMPMPKRDREPEHRTSGWIFSIREQPRRHTRILADNPGLEPRLDEALDEALKAADPDARHRAADEPHLPPDEFPPECPYARDDIPERPFDFDSVKKQRP